MRSFRCRLPDQDKCGHYVTAIWHSTNKVGCGVTSCDFGLYLACNYQPGATSSGNPVSFGGAPCSKCNLNPGTSCDNGICRTCNTPGRGGCRRLIQANARTRTPPLTSTANIWHPKTDARR